MSGKHRPHEPQGTFEVIDRAHTGHESLVTLWDGPGVGKTRLAMEMAEYASSVGFRCSFGRCYEETNLFLSFRSPRSSKVIWRRRRA
jgi:hypothetical protein